MIDGQAQNSDGKVMLFRIMLTPVHVTPCDGRGMGRYDWTNMSFRRVDSRGGIRTSTFRHCDSEIETDILYHRYGAVNSF